MFTNVDLGCIAPNSLKNTVSASPSCVEAKSRRFGLKAHSPQNLLRSVQNASILLEIASLTKSQIMCRSCVDNPELLQIHSFDFFKLWTV